MQKNQRLNPYFQSQTRKPSPLKQSFNYDAKRVSSQDQNKMGGHRYKNENLQEYQGSSDYSHIAILSADEKPKPDTSYSSEASGLMKKSPSFRMKSYKRPTSKKPVDTQKRLEHFWKHRNTRINQLESFVQQLADSSPTNSKPSQQQSKLSSTMGMGQAISDYSTNLSQLEEAERNFEEIHFFQVQFQQRCKHMFQRD